MVNPPLETGCNLVHFAFESPRLDRYARRSTLGLLHETSILQIPMLVQFTAHAKQLRCGKDRGQQSSGPFGVSGIAHFRCGRFSDFIPDDFCCRRTIAWLAR